MKIRPSVIFWNALVFLTVIITGCINFEWLGIEIVFITIGAIGVTLSEDRYDNDDDEFVHYWIILSPFIWLFYIVMNIIMGCVWLKQNIIDNINNWLDNKFTKIK
jgi:hypothetical protein